MKRGEYSIDTSPPSPTRPESIRSRAIKFVSVCMLPLIQRVAREYFGGESVDDALCVAQRLAAQNIPSTLGFWDSADYSGREVADIYLSAIDAVAASGLDAYLSIKAPALRFDPRLASELAGRAQKSGVRLHFDSHGLEVADPSCELVEVMLDQLSPSSLGTTLPGRWSRSLFDADWATECGLSVRVVKGEWPDPTDPARDMRAGFLDVIGLLAGRARHVAVASHDVPLVEKAIAQLRASGTSCELELLYGMPLTHAMNWAKENGVAVRVYIPFGRGYIPYAIGAIRRHPRLAWWIIKNRMTGSRGKKSFPGVT